MRNFGSCNQLLVYYTKQNAQCQQILHNSRKIGKSTEERPPLQMQNRHHGVGKCKLMRRFGTSPTCWLTLILLLVARRFHNLHTRHAPCIPSNCCLASPVPKTKSAMAILPCALVEKLLQKSWQNAVFCATGSLLEVHPCCWVAVVTCQLNAQFVANFFVHGGRNCGCVHLATTQFGQLLERTASK